VVVSEILTVWKWRELMEMGRGGSGNGGRFEEMDVFVTAFLVDNNYSVSVQLN